MAGQRDQVRPNTGLRGLVAWLLQRRAVVDRPPPAADGLPRPIEVAGSQSGWLRVLDANTLLQVVQANKAIGEIWRISRLSKAAFERDCLCAIHRYAEFVQLLPASEAHHHAHAGGLLSHTIEMLLTALTWRNGRLLPEGAPIEVIDAQRDEWTLVVFYAALLHDIAKALTDLRITWRARNLDAVRWMPLAGSLPELAQGRAQAEYLVEFTAKVERDYGAHSRSAVLLLQRIASPTALAILARQPSVFEALNRYLTGQDRDSLLAQIVREADKASVRRALASGSRARFATARAMPLVDLLMHALKTMLRDSAALPLNRSGAAGWVYDGALWLVAKRVADAARDWINKHEPNETMPGETKNDRLFDTWQEYGCILPNPHTGQAIWYVTVHGRPAETAIDADDGQALGQGAYAHDLSVLKFPLEKVFDDPGKYPPNMLGRIEIHEKQRKTKADSTEPGNPEQTADGKAAAAGDDARQARSAAPKRGEQAERKSKPDKPAAAGPTPATSAIKAPTFNKPKPAQSQPTPLRPHDTTPLKAPETGATAEPLINDDEAEYFLDPQDSTSPLQISHDRAQQQLLKVARQARKAEAAGIIVEEPAAVSVTDEAPEPPPRATSAAQSPDDARVLLSQPVGGAHRLLLQTPPTPVGRSAGTNPPEPMPARKSEGMAVSDFKPVLLDPRPHKHAQAGRKAEREVAEATVSPVAQAFIRWLQHGLGPGRTLKYNETGAMVHFVEHGMALVSPLIFKTYAKTQVAEAKQEDHAKLVQRELLKAGLHVAAPNNTNILLYQVLARGGANAGTLAAVVLSDPGRFVQPVPPSNPALELMKKDKVT